MKKKKENELNNNHECDETCECGCNEGNECTCNENCDCGCSEGSKCTCDESCDCGCNESCESEESSCTGSCEGCSGCGEINERMIIEMLSSKNKDLEEKYMRLQAEFLNFKTRTQNEVSKMLKYEGEDFVKKILVFKDNLERAVSLDDSDLSDEVSKFLSGFKLILGNLQTTMEEYEIKEIDCLGKEFDPNTAEAVITEHDNSKPENVVLEVLTKGYIYKDKIIRHACVKVNK